MMNAYRNVRYFVSSPDSKAIGVLMFAFFLAWFLAPLVAPVRYCCKVLGCATAGWGAAAGFCCKTLLSKCSVRSGAWLLVSLQGAGVGMLCAKKTFEC